MANTKISALTALTGANVATGDQFAIVDTSANQTKSITAAELKTFMINAQLGIAGSDANQSINNSSVTAITFDKSINDTTGDMVDLVNERVYVRQAGFVIVSAHIQFAANATGFRQIRLLKNGTMQIRSEGPAVTGTYTGRSIVAFFNVSDGDYFSLDCQQNSGGALNIMGDTSAGTVGGYHLSVLSIAV